MVDLAARVMLLFPSAVSLVDFTVTDTGDGRGPQITLWNTKTLGPQPDSATLAAVDVVGGLAASQLAAKQAAAKANPNNQAFLDQINTLRAALPVPLPPVTIDMLAQSVAGKTP